MDVDSAQLNFNADSIWLLNICIGLIMFGIALDLRPADFARVFKSPKGPLIGLIAQFFVLPAVTFLLTVVFRPHPSIALGMILVAACPGGNLSNFLTYLAKGNAALSLSMTAISTAAAIVMTPLNLTFWGSLNEDTEPIMRAVSLDPLQILGTIVMILGVPLAAGMYFASHHERMADKLHKPFKYFSIFFFLALLGVIFSSNWALFLDYIDQLAFVVLGHNAVALGLAFGLATLGGLAMADRRAVTIEVGIQNSALGLSLIFTFFDGLGGMAMVAGLWGVWHIVSGMALAAYWSRIDPGTAPETAAEEAAA